MVVDDDLIAYPTPFRQSLPLALPAFDERLLATLAGRGEIVVQMSFIRVDLARGIALVETSLGQVRVVSVLETPILAVLGTEHRNNLLPPLSEASRVQAKASWYSRFLSRSSTTSPCSCSLKKEVVC